MSPGATILDKILQKLTFATLAAMDIDIDNLIQPVERYTQPTDEPVLEPYKYLEKIPGNNQNVRTKFLNAFNDLYYHIEYPELLHLIGEIISIFHNSSLLIDDIEDSSDFRRGFPAAHTKFGTPLTINCGNLMYFIALQKAQNELPNLYKQLKERDLEDLEKKNKDQGDKTYLRSTDLDSEPLNLTQLQFETSQILIDEMLNLHHGQGLDIYWRDNLLSIKNKLPEIEEYLAMVKDKTGGLFRLSIKLLDLFSSNNVRNIIPIANLMGIVYQIRDDYLNLIDSKYSHMKGITGEDLIEGKLSLPILHCLRNTVDSPVHKLLFTTSSSDERKKMNELRLECIDFMRDTSKSLDFTRNLIKAYHQKVKELIFADENLDRKLEYMLINIIDGLCDL